MSKFTKGVSKPANSGIKKGQKQLRTLIKNQVENILMSKGKHPVTELMKLIDKGELKPEAQAKVWLQLLEYVAPKLSAQAITVDDAREETEEPIDVTPKTTEELLEIANEDKE